MWVATASSGLSSKRGASSAHDRETRDLDHLSGNEQALDLDPGTGRRVFTEHVDENMGGTGWSLSDEEIATLNEASTWAVSNGDIV